MDNIQTYFLYYFLIITTSFLVFISELLAKTKYSKLGSFIYWSAFILPFAISANRYGIGTDYFHYVELYQELEGYNNIFSAIQNIPYEPGWIILNFAVKVIFDNYQYIFIISSALTMFFIFKTLEYYRGTIYVWFGILIFLTTLYNASFNIIRQVLAAAILLFAIKYIREKKFLIFTIFTMLAASFHYSAIIYFPMYWILNKSRNNSWNTFKKISAILICIIIVLMFENVFDLITNIDIFSKYSNYLIDLSKTSFGATISSVPIMLLILINLKQLKNNAIGNDLVFLSFAGFVLSFLISLNMYIGRLVIYFTMTQILIIPMIIKMEANKNLKFLYTWLIVVYYFSLFTYNIIIHNGHQTIPYNWSYPENLK